MTRTRYVSVEVEVDVADVLDDMTDSDLAELGLMSTTAFPPSHQGWHAVKQAVREGDQRRLLELINQMAWDQAGVVIPVVGNRPLH